MPSSFFRISNFVFRIPVPSPGAASLVVFRSADSAWDFQLHSAAWPPLNSWLAYRLRFSFLQTPGHFSLSLLLATHDSRLTASPHSNGYSVTAVFVLTLSPLRATLVLLSSVPRRPCKFRLFQIVSFPEFLGRPLRHTPLRETPFWQTIAPRPAFVELEPTTST